MPNGLRYAYTLVIVVGGIALLFSGNAQAGWLGVAAIAVAIGLGVLAWRRRS